MAEKIAIYIPDDEAARFLLFQKHYDAFNLLFEHGVFDVKNGTIELNFNKNGVLSSINVRKTLYKDFVNR